ALNVPFTANVDVDSYGDVQSLPNNGGIAELPRSDKKKVEVRWPGQPPLFPAGKEILFDEYRKGIEPLLTGPVSDLAKNPEVEPSTLLLAVNQQVLGEAMQELLHAEPPFYPSGVAARLASRFEQTPWGDIGDAVPDFYREAKEAAKADPGKHVPDAFAV